MPTTLFCWELGGGWAHVMAMEPLLRGLAARGHRLFAAVKDFSLAAPLGAIDGVTLVQAPLKTRESPRPIRPSRSFADVLHNTAFGECDEAQSRVRAWRQLYDWIQPDLVVFDHSPTAILAARDCPFRKVVMGAGFFCPPNATPFPAWSGTSTPPATLQENETRVLDVANAILARISQQPLARLAQLYAEVDETLLATIPEIDHFGARAATRYWGSWLTSAGIAPQWPEGGARVFVYLKASPAVDGVLEALSELGMSAVVYSGALERSTLTKFSDRRNLRFESRLLNLDKVAQECDLAILNASHFTTLTFLLAGRPLLLLPLYLEHALTANRVATQGIGLLAEPTISGMARAQLAQLLGTAAYANRAKAVAAKYAHGTSENQRAMALERLDGLAH